MSRIRKLGISVLLVEAIWHVGKASKRLKRLLGIAALSIGVGVFTACAGGTPIEAPPPYERCAVEGETPTEHATCLSHESGELKCLTGRRYSQYDPICDRFEFGP